MEVNNEANNIKVETLFWGRMYTVRGGGKYHEGEEIEEIFPPGERKYFLPPVNL